MSTVGKKSKMKRLEGIKLVNDCVRLNVYTLKETKKKRGRPSVITQIVVGKLEYAFALDCTVEEACLYAGISRDTYYDFCKKKPDFSDRISELRQVTSLIARTSLINGIESNPSLALKYLEKKKPLEFSQQSIVTHKVEEGEEISPIAKKSVDEVFAMFEKKARDTKASYIVVGD